MVRDDAIAAFFDAAARGELLVKRGPSGTVLAPEARTDPATGSSVLQPLVASGVLPAFRRRGRRSGAGVRAGRKRNGRPISVAANRESFPLSSSRRPWVGSAYRETRAENAAVIVDTY